MTRRYPEPHYPPTLGIRATDHVPQGEQQQISPPAQQPSSPSQPTQYGYTPYQPTSIFSPHQPPQHHPTPPEPRTLAEIDQLRLVTIILFVLAILIISIVMTAVGTSLFSRGVVVVGGILLIKVVDVLLGDSYAIGLTGGHLACLELQERQARLQPPPSTLDK